MNNRSRSLWGTLAGLLAEIAFAVLLAGVGLLASWLFSIG